MYTVKRQDITTYFFENQWDGESISDFYDVVTVPTVEAAQEEILNRATRYEQSLTYIKWPHQIDIHAMRPEIAGTIVVHTASQIGDSISRRQELLMYEIEESTTEAESYR